MIDLNFPPPITNTIRSFHAWSDGLIGMKSERRQVTEAQSQSPINKKKVGTKSKVMTTENTKKKGGIIVIGSGRMGQIRAGIIYSNPRLKIIGIVDLNLNGAKELADKYSVSLPSTTSFFTHSFLRKLHCTLYYKSNTLDVIFESWILLHTYYRTALYWCMRIHSWKLWFWI